MTDESAQSAVADTTADDTTADGSAPDVEDAVDAVDGEDGDDEPPESSLEEEGEIAADYIEGLLDITDLDGDIDMDVEGTRAVVAVVGERLDHLVGEDGKTLEALQELTRLAVQQQTGERSRLMLDVGGFRQRRRDELTKLAGDVIEDVKASGEPKRLAPMTPFERKCVHDVVAAAGLSSESEGEEPERRVVVLPS